MKRERVSGVTESPSLFPFSGGGKLKTVRSVLRQEMAMRWPHSNLHFMFHPLPDHPSKLGLLTFLWVAHSGTVDTGGLPDGRQSRSSCSEGPLNGFAYSGGGPSQTGLTDGEPSMDPQKSQ